MSKPTVTKLKTFNESISNDIQHKLERHLIEIQTNGAKAVALVYVDGSGDIVTDFFGGRMLDAYVAVAALEKLKAQLVQQILDSDDEFEP